MQRLILWLVLSFVAFTRIAAQVNHSDSLALRMDALFRKISALKTIKLTGYVQAQWQKADSAGIASAESGNFPTHADNLFTISRGVSDWLSSRAQVQY